jgi:DNA polymerase-3 subunit epsilon
MQVTDFVYVDIETTGGDSMRDGITEIAWLHVRAGEVIQQYTQLLDPQQPIPYHIQQFTGITDDMVEGCPRFEDIAEELLEALDGKIFVAHNARFDYGFIKNAFSRCGLHYSAPVLCTVKLSRRLYPQHKRHNLDSLIERHQLHCEERHRAMGDAKVMYQFVEQARQEYGAEWLQQHIEALLKKPVLPPGIEEQALDHLPAGPGVYIFYDAGDVPLYVGKSVNLRARVLAHFNSDRPTSKDQRINRQLARIETITTAGELGALLKEAQLVKQLSPMFNRQLRRYDNLYTIEYDTSAPLTAGTPVISAIDRELLQRQEHLFGLYRTRKQAIGKLKKLAEVRELCLKTLGLEKGSGPCFNYQLDKCKGVCAGRESHLQHQIRIMQALLPLKLNNWPYPGPIGIRETAAGGSHQDIHFIDRWFYLGSTTAESQIPFADILERDIDFDIDAYNILTRFVTKHAGKLDIVRTG